MRKPKGWWDVLSNQKEFLRSISNKLGIKESVEWYKVSPSVVREHGGSQLLSKYNSFTELLQEHYPVPLATLFDHKSFPLGFWNNLHHRKAYVNYLEEKLNITSPEHWKNISQQEILELGGGSFIRFYKSLPSVLEDLYPEHQETWKTLFPPKRQYSYWKSTENRKEFLDNIVKKLKLESPYDIKVSDIIENGGSGIFRHFPVLQDAIQYHYPDISLTEMYSCSHSFPKNFWKDKKNQKEFLDYFAEKNNLHSPEDWKQISVKDIHNAGGRSLFDYYSNLYEALNNLYPDKDWDIMDVRNRVPRNYWNDKQNHREFMDSLMKKLNLKDPLDWYTISVETIKQNGGSKMLACYPNILSALEEIYPECNWDPYLRLSLPNNYWDNDEHVTVFIKKCEEFFNIHSSEDWYRVSVQQIIMLKGFTLLKKYGSLYNLLCKVYPTINWSKKRLTSSNKRATQRWLFIQISKLFPENIEIYEDYLFDLSRESSFSIEFDIWIPSKKLALEYHGEHHYHDIPFFGSKELYQKRDEEKRILCKENDITLVEVPYWWTGSLDELQSLIQKHNVSIRTNIQKKE